MSAYEFLLNCEKSQYLLCSLYPQSIHPVSLSQSLQVNGNELKRTDQLRYLGVYFDRQMSFSANTARLCARAKAAMGVLSRVICRWTTRDVFKVLYTKKIAPMLFYALPVACPTLKKDWLILEKAQRFACRLAQNNYTKSYANLLEDLHWKPVTRLCFECQLLFYMDFTFFQSGH